MSRYIDVEKFICSLDGSECLDTERDYEEIERRLEEFETADVQEVKHAKWELSTEPLGQQDVDCAKCSLCGELFIVDKDYDFDYIKEFFKYCPNCGAKMDEKPKSDNNVVEKVYCKDYHFLETESENNANKLCLWEESDYKPCELQAIDCENCDYYASIESESNNESEI